jgi:NodT family efflux transporter outer membrane factor (OMF) lipoprotein
MNPLHFPRLLLPVLLVALLGACASMDKAPVATKELNIATLGARDASVTWPAQAWWSRYNDPQLDRLIDEGLAGSPTLTAASARVASANAAAGIARAALLPQVSANVLSTYQRYSENYIYPPPLAGNWNSDNRLSLDLTWEIDFWNKNGAALEASLSQAQAAAAEAQVARVVLTTSIARAYFNLQRLFAQRDVSSAAIVQRDEVVRITAQRFSAGLDTKVEVRQAEAALATVRTELAQYDVDIAVARNQLAALTGAGPERGDSIVAVAIPASMAISPSVIPLDLVARRPEIVASRWRVEAAQHDVDVAKALFYPNVNIAAFAGFSSFGLSKFLTSGSTVAGVGPAIHLPIFEGGRLNANLRGRDAETDLAVSMYNQTVIDAVHDVADVVASIRGLARVTVEQARAKDATTDAYNIAVIRYKAGLGNYLTVLTAQTQQLVQDRLDADLKSRAFELDVSLARALGGGFVEPSAEHMSAELPAAPAKAALR